MCGIGGHFSLTADVGSRTLALARLQEALRHRGPDGSGSQVVGAAAFAQTRLAIIDIETGQQPLWNHDRTLVIVFNGEIYNYRELREDYARRGEQFRTKSDTEVVLAAYRADGLAGFSRLRGMYAFAIWDCTAGHGYLVRDPLGIKPLFVAQLADGDLCFASEAKGILAFCQHRFELDTNALHQLLNFRYVPGALSLFKGIRQLNPGEILEWDGKSIKSRQHTGSAEGRSGDLLAVLADSVSAHLVADVPVGLYLSGGIDSGVVAALARQQSTSPLASFTLDVGDDPNEARNAAETARYLGLSNRAGRIEEIDGRKLARQLWHLEVPKVNAVQLFELARFARYETKVVLSGLGGDELFCGYTAHRILQFFQVLNARFGSALPRAIGRLTAPLVRLGARIDNTEAERLAGMAAASGDWPRAYGLLRNLWDFPARRNWLYGPRILDTQLQDAFDIVRSDWTGDTPIAAMLDYEWRHKMVNDLLWQEDRASMACGLEVRTPYVDQWVFSSVRNSPTPQPGKKELKGVAADLLPPSVLRRPKSGFQLDAPAFFSTRLRGLADEWLNDSAVRRYQLFNPKAVAELRRLPASKRYRWHFFLLFLMMQAHIWIELFERGESIEGLSA